MLPKRIKLTWAMLGIVLGLAGTAAFAPSASGAEVAFAGCPELCEHVDCWNPSEGWCLNHCNALCEVCS